MAPSGTSVASQSRVSSITLVCMARLVRGDGVLLALQRRAQGVPCERRGLYPDGILGNSGKRLELAEVVRFGSVFARHNVVKLLEQLLGLFDALPFECLGHHRSGSFGNRATGTLE